MLAIEKKSPNRVDIELTAVLDADIMAAALDELIEAARDVRQGVMLYRVTSFSLPTGGALVAEMMRLPQLLEAISHFRRCAVLTDIGWVQVAAELEGLMIPGLEIKSFALDDTEAAEAWLAGASADDDDPNLPV